MWLSKFDGPLISDRTPASDLFPGALGRGYVPRDFDAEPVGTYVRPFSLTPIPRGEWADRIQERERRKAKLRDVKRWRGFRSLDQQSTNYCWCNAVVAGIHYVRAIAGRPHVDLSPASVAAPIKDYKNVGGWGSEAVRYIAQHGVAPQSVWPANAIDRKYDNDESRAARRMVKIVEFEEAKPRSFAELASALLAGFPVAVGYNWWGHEVLAHDLVLLGNDEFGVEIDNSWGGWGDEGHGVLTEKKATPDEAMVLRFVTPQ